MKKLYTLLALLLFLPLAIKAQVHYPIRTNTLVTPPVPFSLDGFVSQPGKIMLSIMVDDVTLNQYPVKLRLHIEGNGIRISTNPNVPQQPIFLDGGATTQLTGSDLEFFFNPDNLLFQGYSLNEYRRNGRLPEGVYRIRFEVLDYYRNFQISSAIPAVAMLSLTNGPVLTFPTNRSEVDIDSNPVLRFSWMAVFTAIPDAMIEYRFRIWQIRPDSRDPYEITRVTAPVYEVDLNETALLYDGSLPPLVRGARYVWQVTAVDQAGMVLFKNDGASDISTFRYGYECAAPSAVISKVAHNSVSVSWNSNTAVNEYTVSYRKENASEWQEVSTRSIGVTIENLEHSTQYELLVKAACGDEVSNNERLMRFKTDRFVDYTCGAGAPLMSFQNQDPLPALHRFDEFKAADFYIDVTEVSGTQGVFSGRGLASVPYLSFIQFEVVFNNITVNTDRQMIDGHVVFLYDEATGMIIGGDMGLGGSQTDDEPGVFSFEEALDHLADQTVTLNEEVTSVTVNNGQVTVVTESGQTKNYLVGENQTLAIVSPEGIVIVDQASGQVFQAPTSSPGSASNVRTPSQSKIHGCLVSFSPLATQRFGFDAVGNGIVKPNNYFLRDRNGDAIPWKSLEVGNTDRVAMLSNGDCQSDSLRFIRESGILTPTSPGRNNSLELLLTGGFEGQEERLTVARASTHHINDSTTQEILTEAGVLGLVTYKRITQNVVLVPVNSSSFPSPGVDRSVIIKRLNEIYGPGLVNWNVHVDNAIEVGKLEEADFKVEGTSMLSKYTSDMNKVIRRYKRDRPTDDNTMYLFFVQISDMGSSRKGFMPLAGNYGFIFNFNVQDFDLLAHELAHGTFNLRHTFSDKAQNYFPEKQTANLMDYAGGVELWKYQWDLIHNPEKILFSWSQDEEEGAALNTPGLQELIDRIKKANLNKQNYIQFHDYKTRNVAKNIVYLQQTVKLLNDEIPLGAALHVFSKEDINKLTSNFHDHIDYRTPGVIGNVPGGFTYRMDFEYLDVDAVLNEGNYENPKVALKFFLKKENYEMLRKYLSGESTLESFKDYIVFKDDANIREKESPYNLVKPLEFLEKGKMVELVSHLTTGNAARTLVRYKDGTEEYCTSTSNLRQIIPIEDEQQYKLREDMSPFTLPYSDKTEKKVKTSEILYVTHDCGEYKGINKKDDDKYEFLGWVKAESLKVYVDNSKLGKDEFSQKYLKAAETAVDNIIEDWEINEAACNLCVRATLYNLTGDEVLYPKTGSSITIRDKGEQLYGKVEAGSGSAQGIIDDLKAGNLNEYFEEIKKSSSETYAQFWKKIQDMVDNKEIVIGTYDPGHVFMVVPGGLYEVVDNTQRERAGTNLTNTMVELGDRWGGSFARKGFDYVLRIMDCGWGVKFSSGPAYGVMDARPFIGERDDRIVKFYKYKQK